MNIKKASIYIGITLLGIFIVYSTSSSSWNACKYCKIQEYERTIFFTPLEAISEREYDEFGTYEKYKEKFGEHEHEFVTIQKCSLFTCNGKDPGLEYFKEITPTS